MKNYKREVLHNFAVQYLLKKGVTKGNALLIADSAVETEAMGVHTHGMSVFPYFEQAIFNIIDPKAEPVVIREKGSTALIDGNNGFSQLALKLASDLAIEKAKNNGTATIIGNNCSWLAALGTYLYPIVEKGYIAQLWAQTSTCVDAAPVGGIDPKFSTNPIALGFPASFGPSIFDIATTSISKRKVLQMVEDGELAPEKIFLDKDGNLSRDPKVVIEGGTILFLGGDYLGYKGYGLSLFNESLAAVAGGSCNNPHSETRQCFTLIVIDPEAFGGHDYYTKEMERFIGHVKASRLRPKVSGIRFPGEHRREILEESNVEGVKLNESLVIQLTELAKTYGIEWLD